MRGRQEVEVRRMREDRSGRRAAGRGGHRWARGGCGWRARGEPQGHFLPPHSRLSPSCGAPGTDGMALPLASPQPAAECGLPVVACARCPHHGGSFSPLPLFSQAALPPGPSASRAVRVASAARGAQPKQKPGDWRERCVQSAGRGLRPV